MNRKKRKGNYRRGRQPLGPQHYAAIELLTSIPRKSYDEIAAAVGINRRTLYRWRHRKDFARELRRADQRSIRLFRQSMKKTCLLSLARRGDVDALEWFFTEAGFI